jgi:superfamily I DNA/RNA helicase
MTGRHDPDHDQVCASQGKHLLVIAPPGTGKTHLSVRLAGSIAPTLRPSERVLLITFSNQARVRLEDEAATQLPPAIRERVEVTNYHRLFWRGVRAYRRALGIPLTVQIGSRQQRLQAMQRTDAKAVAALKASDGLLDGLAECRFPRFHDSRTPGPDTLARLLDAVQNEHRLGRLVFDDLGALFWALLETFPAVESAYRARFPVVIADEHQDASELQDAVVRRLAQRRLVILADPMQLIYEFRGSQPERLDRHVEGCDERFELRTPHRWHGAASIGQWLQAVRARLVNGVQVAEAPASFKLVKTNAAHRLNGMKSSVKSAVSAAFRKGAATVAILSAWNRDVDELRGYLSREGMFPRQVGGNDFEDARKDIERVPECHDALAVAKHALARVDALVPTLDGAVLKQVERRLSANGVNTRGSGDEAAGLLRALHPIFVNGPGSFVRSVVACLDHCKRVGHHLPRAEAVRALREAGECRSEDLGEVLARYAEATVVAAHSAPRSSRGLFVMTAHQAKGKEFDAVVLVNVNADNFPDTDEGRRLFYVAITRASKSWTVIAPDAKASPLLRHL